MEVSDNSTPAARPPTQSFTVDVNSVESPFVETIPGQGVDIGNTLTFDVRQYVFDPNSPPFPLTYSLIGTVPSGAGINPTTGLFTWKPSSNQSLGDVTIDVQVSDNESPPRTGSGSFIVEVGAPGAILSPVLAPIPTGTVEAGNTDTLFLAEYASDPNSPPLPLTYSLTGTVPSGASIDPSTGVFTWNTPSDQAPGLTSFTVMVSDDSTPALSASETFSVNVLSASGIYAPVLQAIPAQNVDIGSPLQLDVSNYASDPNFPALPLTYTLGAGAPAGASIDPTTGLFSWTPAAGQATGSTPITVIVSDNQTPANTVTGTFSVNVFPAGTILPPTLGFIPNQFTEVGTAFHLDISQYASDPNTPALPLTYSLLAGAPPGMSINPATGLLTWTPTSNQSSQTFPVTVIAADNQSPALYASETFDVQVISSFILAPILQGVPPLEVDLGSTLTFDFGNYASDPNVPPLPLDLQPWSRRSPSRREHQPEHRDLHLDAGTGAQSTGPVDLTVIVSDDESPPASASIGMQIQVSAAGTTATGHSRDNPGWSEPGQRSASNFSSTSANMSGSSTPRRCP